MRSLTSKLEVIIAVIGFTIFGYSKVCRAECAWVLWEKESRKSQVNWEIFQAFPKYDQCVSAQRELFEQQKIGFERIKEDKSNQLKRIGSFPFKIILDYEDGSQRVFEFHCFPDTIDPRK